MTDNLTRVEADLRSKQVSDVKYKIYLDITSSIGNSSQNSTFVSKSNITFNFNEVDGIKHGLFLDLKASSVSSITLNGECITNDAFVEHRIKLSANVLQIGANNVEVIANCEYTNTGEGLHRYYAEDEDNTYLYTQFEVADSRRMYAVFEQPDIKATFDFQVKAPKGWILTSTEPETSVEDADDASIWTFGTTPVMSSYLTSLVAGPFKFWETEHLNKDGRIIKMRILARKSLAKFMDYDVVFDYTKAGFDYYADLFGVPYPYTKYDQIFMPQFNAGAMENIGNVTYREDYVFNVQVTDALKERRVITILHELAHMWFGNLVTMKWWNDLWLNESFAEYVSTLCTAEATRHKDIWVQFNAREKSWGLEQDLLCSTHPIAANIKDLNDVLVNFDGITYAKGAAVLQALTNFCSRDKFFEGIGNYLRKFSYSNATLDDLIAELEAVCRKDVKSWSKYWIESAGPNTLQIDYEEKNGVFTKFDVIQTASVENPDLRPHTLNIGLYNFSDGTDATSEDVNITATGSLNLRGAKLQRTAVFPVLIDANYSTSIRELIGEKRPDLILLNDGGLTFAKVLLDDVSTEVALRYPHKIADPLARSLVLDDLWFAMRDAKIAPEKYVDATFKALASETQSIVLKTLLDRLLVTVFTYIKPTERVQMIKGVATNLWNLAKDAITSDDDAHPQAKDAQYQFLTTFLRFASTGDHISVAHALLKNELHLRSLKVDTKLKWDIRTALAREGAIGKQELRLAREEDLTEHGRLGVAKALAALNTKDAKRVAFDSVYSKFSELSNAEIEATALGFNDVLDANILQDFMYEYFDRINEVWDSRDFAVAETIVEAFYPARVANLELAQLGERWLENNQHRPDALKRIVSENLDRTRRALAVQKATTNSTSHA